MVTYADRVQETFTTTGTGSISLGGAVAGYQAFSAVLSNSGTCYYAATDGTNWEIGLGTYATSGDTLARTTILASSNAGSAVNWAAGTKSIWLTLPASAIAGFSSSLAVGTTLISGGTSGYIEYNNGGVLGEKAVTGSGPVVLQTSALLASPIFTAPALGTPVSGNLSNCTGFPATVMTALAVGSVILAELNGGVWSAGTNYAAASVKAWTIGAQSSADTLSGTWQALQTASGTSPNAVPFCRVA